MTNIKYTQKIADSFNNATNTYDVYAKAQLESAKLLTNQITKLGNINSILEIGCGTGILTKLVTEEISYNIYHATDISENMLSKAKGKLHNIDDIEFFKLDMNDLNLDRYYDMVISNFVFQWSSDLNLLLNNLLQYSDKIIFTTILDGSFENWIKLNYEYNLKPSIIRLLSIQEISDILNNIPHIKYNIKIEKLNYKFDSILDFLRSWKYIGAHTAPQDYKLDYKLLNLMKKYNSSIDINYNILFCIIEKL